MKTRAPLPEHRPALIEIIAPAVDGTFRAEEVACAVELLDSALEQPPGNTYEARILVDEQDRPVAYGCFGHTPLTEAAYDLYWLVTDARHRGKGLGRRLLGDIEDELRDRGARVVRIETSSVEGQGGALRFYQQAGY